MFPPISITVSNQSMCANWGRCSILNTLRYASCDMPRLFFVFFAAIEICSVTPTAVAVAQDACMGAKIAPFYLLCFGNVYGLYNRWRQCPFILMYKCRLILFQFH